jgi:hypothetical protein
MNPEVARTQVALHVPNMHQKVLGDAELVLGMRIRRDRGARILKLDRLSAWCPAISHGLRRHTPEDSNMRLSAVRLPSLRTNSVSENLDRKGAAGAGGMPAVCGPQHPSRHRSCREPAEAALSLPVGAGWRPGEVLRYLAATPSLCLTFAPDGMSKKYFFSWVWCQ